MFYKSSNFFHFFIYSKTQGFYSKLTSSVVYTIHISYETY